VLRRAWDSGLLDRWPAWTEVPLERIGLVLLDESGAPLAPKSGEG
jgi:hypothetical protein